MESITDTEDMLSNVLILAFIANVYTGLKNLDKNLGGIVSQ